MSIHNNRSHGHNKRRMRPLLLTNANIATMTGDAPYGLVAQGAVALSGDRIAWAGPMTELPPEHADDETRDLQGRLVTPALIDCHTHIVHGGNRAREFEMRQQGRSYEDIARAGGGIVSTVTATRKASLDDLIASALPRVDALLAEGVSTIEIKSGYGLDRDTELTMLRAARAIGQTPQGPHPHQLSRRPCRARRDEGQTRRLYRRDLHPDPARRPCRRPGRCGRRLLRRHRLRSRPDRARLQGRPRSGLAGQAACRAVVEPRRRATGRPLRRAFRRSPGIRQRRRRPRDGAGGQRRRDPARCVLYPARNPQTAHRRLPRRRRADGAGHRLQPRLVADDLAAADDEHGLHPVRPDPRRGACAARHDTPPARLG